MANFYTDNRDLKFHLTHPLMQRVVELREENYTQKDRFEDAPLNYEDAIDSYDKVLEVIGEICGDIVAPNAEGVDANGPKVIDNHVEYAEGTAKNLKALRQANLMGITLPRQYGGLNLSVIPYTMAADIVSRADAGFVNIWGLQDCAETIHEFANEDQKERYLTRVCQGETCAMDLTEPDAGSDLQAVQLKATQKEDGSWVLNGVKRFITNGDGDISLVLARSEEGTNDGRGLSMFIYDRRSNAVKVRRIEHKMGIIGSPTCELVFTNAPAELVGDRKMGLIKYVMALMNGARLGIGAQSVGVAEAAYREALAYAKERKQFGKAIIEFPAVREMLVNMKARLDASRTLLYQTCRFVDLYKTLEQTSRKRTLSKEERDEMKYYQKLADIYTPLLKGTASEWCNKAAYDAIQIHGGSGFMKDYPVERIYRDARITSIYEGTTQLQVVAAIRGVTTGGYLKHIKEAYETATITPELQPIKDSLQAMTAEYEQAVSIVTTPKNTEFLDFHARRLVEMAGNIVMGYLLLLDAVRDNHYQRSAEVFVNLGYAENKERLLYIQRMDESKLAQYQLA